MIVENRFDPGQGPRLHRRIVERPSFDWLDPPPMEGRMTVLDVVSAQGPREHQRLVRAWAEDVWQAWASHHQVVRGWIGELGLS